MNLYKLKLKPMIIKRTVGIFSDFDVIGVRQPNDFRNLKFINHMTCIDALTLINRSFSLGMSSDLHNKLYRNYCIYYKHPTTHKDIIISIIDIPVLTLKIIYNNIYIAQDNTEHAIKVNEINMFEFGGL